MKYFTFFIALLTSIALDAQVQKGYIMKIERPDHPSVGIDSVLVQIEGTQRIRSNKEGFFSFVYSKDTEEATYKLKTVLKPGYELHNPADLKEYNYSTLPVNIYMYSVSEKLKEEERIFVGLYKQLQKQYELKTDSLYNELEESNKVKGEIEEQLKRLEQEFKSSSDLLKRLASHCATINLSALNEENKLLQTYIQSGEIDKILSYIENNGGLDKIEEDALNAQEEARNAKIISKEKEEEATQKTKKAIYSFNSKYIEAISQFDMKNAALFSMKIANLDKEDFNNQIQASNTCFCIGEYEDAIKYAQQAMSIAESSESRCQKSMANECMASIYAGLLDVEKSYDYYFEGIFPYFDVVFNELNDGDVLQRSDSIQISNCSAGIALTRSFKGDYESVASWFGLSFKYSPQGLNSEIIWTYIPILIASKEFEAAKEICISYLSVLENAYEKDNISMAGYSTLVCLNMYLSIAEGHTFDGESAVRHAKKALEYLPNSELYENNEIKRNLYMALSNAYRSNKMFDESIAYADSAWNYYQNSYNKDTLTMLALINNSGVISYDQKRYDKAIEYFKNALKLNPENKSKAQLFDNLGQNYKEKNMFDSAYYYYNKAIEIREINRYKDLGARELCESYKNIANAYWRDEKVLDSFKYYEKAREIFEYLEDSLSEQRMKRNSYLVLFHGTQNKPEDKELSVFYNDYMKSQVFKLSSQEDDTLSYIIISFGDWDISKNQDAVEDFKRIENDDVILLFNDNRIQSYKKSELQNMVIHLTDINPKEKEKIIKMYGKYKRKNR